MIRFAFAVFVLLSALHPGALILADERPNVLFIAIDDLNDWIGCMGGHPQAKTPNIDRLAASGMLFLNAHCAAPLCNPSRASVMTGMLPSTSGVHGNQQDWRESPFLKGKMTLPQYFKEHGYWTGGCGKLFHANHGGECAALNGGHGGLRGFKHPASWTESFPSKDQQLSKPAVLPGQNFNGLDIWHWDWGPIPVADDLTTDGRSTNWAVEQIKRKHDRPFFLAVGIYRPHGPWYVPQKYFDQHPLDKIVLPTLKEDDLDDVPEIAKGYLKNYGANLHQRILDNNLYRSAVQAYLANVTFADAMVGKVLDALNDSPYADNTIVCLWSDHGWHLGEKQRWHKSTEWEEATRVPLIIRVPKMETSGTTTASVASLVDLYPTLVESCGLPGRDDLDGESLVPQLNDPNSKRKTPAITTLGGKHHSIRNERWRYTRYSNGAEELYDHQNDPNEWTNLANDPKQTAIKEELANWIPKVTNVVDEPSDAHREPDFRPIFNTYDLTSWDGDPKVWRVEDGVIIGQMPSDSRPFHDTSLIWRGATLKDFELRLQFRLHDDEGFSATGVHYRSGEVKNAGRWYLAGYHAMLAPQKNMFGSFVNYQTNGSRTAPSVAKSPEVLARFKPNEWQDLTIIARGNQIIHKVNGVTAVDFNYADMRTSRSAGLIGLRLGRNAKGPVEFQNLRIRQTDKIEPPNETN